MHLHVKGFTGIKTMSFRISGPFVSTLPGLVIVKVKDTMSYSKESEPLNEAQGNCFINITWRFLETPALENVLQETFLVVQYTLVPNLPFILLTQGILFVQS